MWLVDLTMVSVETETFKGKTEVVGRDEGQVNLAVFSNIDDANSFINLQMKNVTELEKSNNGVNRGWVSLHPDNNFTYDRCYQLDSTETINDYSVTNSYRATLKQICDYRRFARKI